MNKKLFLAASVLAVGGLLAACGTDETSEGTTEDTPTQAVEEQNDTTTSEDGKEEETEQGESAEQDTDPAGAADDSEEPAEEPAEDNPAVNEGTLTASDSQSYELYLLPSYELTAEEPNKDVVYSTENDALFMRIETFKPDEADFAFAEESIQQTVQASNENAELTELPAFEGEEFKNSSVYEIPTENGKVTGVAFEKDGLVVKLTIFDLTEAGVTEEFLNMGKTIVPANK